MLFHKKKKEEYLAFMSGKLIDLKMVEDPVFSTKMMGDGLAIVPDFDEVVAPCDGEVTTVFPSGHAYGLKQKNGRELLLHLGIDTIELKGEGFERFVTVGQQVKAGDLLGKMNLEVVKAAGKSTTSMLVFTSGEKVVLLKENQHIKLREGQILKVE
ncbi:PTS sugar transporter subunit IIA [Enterococcus sp. LJL98]